MGKPILILFFSVLTLSGFSQVKKANPVYNKTDFRDSVYFEKSPVLLHLTKDSVNGNIIRILPNGNLVKGGANGTSGGGIIANPATTYSPLFLIGKNDTTTTNVVKIPVTKVNYSTFQYKTDTTTRLTGGLGSGQVSDSAIMNANAYMGTTFWTNDTLIITKIIAQCDHGIGLDTFSYTIWYNTVANSVGTKLNSASIGVGRVTGTNTSLTTGFITLNSALTKYKIPKNNFIRITLDGVANGRKPTGISISIIGYTKH